METNKTEWNKNAANKKHNNSDNDNQIHSSVPTKKDFQR